MNVDQVANLIVFLDEKDRRRGTNWRNVFPDVWKAKGFDAFISLHLNAFDGSGQPGTEVFVTTFANELQVAAAQKVCDSICKELGTTNRGVKKTNFTVIKEADKLIDGPVMLIEAFFVTNMSLNAATIWATRAAKATAKAIQGVV